MNCSVASDNREFADFPDSYVLVGHDRGKDFVIDMFLIPRDFRKTGEGRAFYNAFERWCFADGNTENIRLMAVDSGGGHSKGFWLKMGFQFVEDGRDPDDDNGRYWMEKTFLSSSAHKGNVLSGS